MPARQRATSKPKAKAGKKEEGGEGEGKEEQSQEGHRELHQEQQRPARRGGVSWSPVFKRIGFFLLIICIPALLNYAALNQEMRMLLPNGT